MPAPGSAVVFLPMRSLEAQTSGGRDVAKISRRVGWLIATLAICTSLALAQSKSDLAGSWDGTLDTGGPKLRLVLDVKGSAGAYTGTLTSVDQAGAVIPIATVAIEGDTVRLDVPAVMGKYEGKFASTTKLTGTWSQLGMSFPLELTKKP